jgi:GTP-binding protein
MIIKSADFITSAVEASQYPSHELPEVAFAGRSNVGKSSLINTLVNRKRLVKTSSTPGRTQLINFFDINGTFCFVDLPGYGYAKVPAKVKQKWGAMIEKYLSGRPNLKGVVLIFDIRRIPNEIEFNMINWLHQLGLPVILVLTKTDKLSPNKLRQQKELISKAFGVIKPDQVLFSAKTRLGRETLLKQLYEIISA